MIWIDSNSHRSFEWGPAYDCHLEFRPVVRNHVISSSYIHVCTGMYWVCTIIIVCKFAMDWGTDLVFKHHCLDVQHTQFHYLQSKVTKQYPQNFFGKLGTYWYILVCMWYISSISRCTSWRTWTISREWLGILMFGYHNILVLHTQYRFPQAKLTKLSAQNVTVKPELGTDNYIPMTYRYVPMMCKYIL